MINPLAVEIVYRKNIQCYKNMPRGEPFAGICQRPGCGLRLHPSRSYVDYKNRILHHKCVGILTESTYMKKICVKLLNEGLLPVIMSSGNKFTFCYIYFF